MSESHDKLATPLWNYALQVYAQTSARGWMQVLKAVAEPNACNDS